MAAGATSVVPHRPQAHVSPHHRGQYQRKRQFPTFGQIDKQEQCEVVVLSLVDTGQAKLSSLELLLGGTTAHAIYTPAKFPAAPQPDHDVNAAAEHRMNLTVRHLTAIGCQASGLISDVDLVKAVEAETRNHD
jgi:hypothetical protein